MCRDGFRAPCEQEGCTNEVTCRDRPRLCGEHNEWLAWEGWARDEAGRETLVRGRLVDSRDVLSDANLDRTLASSDWQLSREELRALLVVALNTQ